MDELRDILEVLKREEALMNLLDEDERLLSQVDPSYSDTLQHPCPGRTGIGQDLDLPGG